MENEQHIQQVIIRYIDLAKYRKKNGGYNLKKLSEELEKMEQLAYLKPSYIYKVLRKFDKLLNKDWLELRSLNCDGYHEIVP
ncbi:hypothetical protein VIBR0546_04467 [Vibrio brasiliensis LMG 20546]|uniref:Uncharacterized protein n=1 Tax=Vibrio brasiliensis LMG 20546 TaxID=945543 RepID=E8LNP2_9VIBR|nr:hypothetical protein VIBR0546_04467 [Vibrio brasiliensis LMG 20546]